jgi:hypothetical protein
VIGDPPIIIKKKRGLFLYKPRLRRTSYAYSYDVAIKT